MRNLGDLVGIGSTSDLLMQANRVAKRAIDIVVASIALMAAAPIILCAAFVVRLLDGSPAFFRQERSGLDGRSISVPKIRTMRRDAGSGFVSTSPQTPESERSGKPPIS